MMKIKTQKPTELDVSLRYICPECGLDHWLFLRESKTKNYKIVCDCGAVFKPKLIESIRIKYSKKKSKKINNNTSSQSITENTADLINKEVFSKTLKILITYGFAKSEARNLVIEAYNRTLNNDAGYLVKNILENLGDTNA